MGKRILNDEQIIEVYQAVWRGEESQVAISKRYGVSPTMISGIKVGRIFNNITNHQTEKDWFEALHK